MQGFLSFLVVISFIILIVGIVVWFIRRRSTKKPFSKRSKKVMWASLAIFFISFLFTDSTTSESETAIKEEIQPVVEAEETKAESSEKDKEAALVKEKEVEAEKARLAEEKEKLAAEKKAEEERIATERKAAEEKIAAEKLAAEKKAAEEKAATERLALEQKAAEEKAAQAAAASAASTPSSSENFSNCTELRTVYPAGVPKGHAAYQSKMDRDKDDYACEA